MCAGLLHHLPKHFGIFQHGTGAQMILVKGLPIMIGHENGGFQRLQQRHVPNIGVGIVNEHAGVHVAIGIDMEIPPPACNASAHEFA